MEATEVLNLDVAGHTDLFFLFHLWQGFSNLGTTVVLDYIFFVVKGCPAH